MMKKRLRHGVFLAVMLQSAVCAVSAGESLPAETALSLRLAVAGTPGGVQEAMAKAFADEFALGGRFAVSVSMDSGPDAEATVYGNLPGGLADMALVEVRVLGARNPRLAILTQPFVFYDASQAARFLNGAGGNRIRTLVGRDGIQIVGWVQGGNALVFSDKALVAPEDFREVRIAGPMSRNLIAAFSALGAAATSMPLDQGLEAVRSGSAGAVICHAADLLGREYPASLTTAMAIGHDLPFFAVCVSRAAWSRIPEDARPFFLSLAERAVKAASQAASSEAAAAASELAGTGVVFAAADISALREAAWPAIVNFLSGVDPELMREMESSAVPVTAW